MGGTSETWKRGRRVRRSGAVALVATMLGSLAGAAPAARGRCSVRAVAGGVSSVRYAVK